MAASRCPRTPRCHSSHPSKCPLLWRASVEARCSRCWRCHSITPPGAAAPRAAIVDCLPSREERRGSTPLETATTPFRSSSDVPRFRGGSAHPLLLLPLLCIPCDTAAAEADLSDCLPTHRRCRISAPLATAEPRACPFVHSITVGCAGANVLADVGASLHK